MSASISSQTAPRVPPLAGPEPQQPLLELRDVKVHFPFRRGGWWRGQRGFIRAVDGVSLQVQPGETLGVVGESGCGKSTLARAIMGLVPVSSGTIHFEGTRLDNLSETQMRPHRRKLQMIFQDPFASLNPRMTVGDIITEPMGIFRLYPRREQKLEALRLMEMVGLNPRFLNRYPHEFSGGQRQRIGIARALAVQPKMLVCDEPISALDVSIQAQVVNLLMDLQRRLGLTYLFIAHDLGVVRHVASRIAVMYLGRIVELSRPGPLFANPLHPYTQALLSAIPVPDPASQRSRQRIVLRGEVPTPDREYPGCPFADRCPLAEDRCREIVPRLEGTTRQVACIKVDPQTLRPPDAGAAP